MLSIGSIVGASVDYGTHSIKGRQAYQIPLAIFFVAPTLQAVLMFFLAPESPRWLMVQRKEQEAEASLRRLRNSKIDELEFQAEFNEIRQSTREQLEQNKKYLFLEMWRGTNLRRTLLSIAVVCFHAANGYVIWIKDTQIKANSNVIARAGSTFTPHISYKLLESKNHSNTRFLSLARACLV